MPAFEYRSISDHYRLRPARQVLSGVSWLSATAGSGGKCSVIVGPKGQAIFFADGVDVELESRIEESLREKPATLTEMNEPWLDYVRFLAAQWSIKWGFEPTGDRFVFYLTRELFDRGILPDEKSEVAIFAVGDFFEVWKTESWISHAKETFDDLGGVTARARLRLKSR